MVFSSISASDCLVSLFSVTFTLMEPAFDSDVAGVDILLYPADDTGVAPSPSEVPLPSFGCQRIDIPMSTQESSGRDIPGTSPVEQVKDDRKCLLEESSSSSSRSCTPEVASEDSDRSVGHRPKPKQKTGSRTPRGSVGQALQEKRGDRTCLELWSFVRVLRKSKPVQPDVSVLYDMADKAVSMATFRQTEQVSFPAAASSSQLRLPPPPPPPPPTSSGIGCTPTAPPKHAGDALLTTSGQDLRTELVLSRVVGGAVSVKLKSCRVVSS